jgi:formate hydrogenlyase transcriptional activator
VPLLTAGRAIGVLHVGSREASRYTAEDAEFLLALARQIALAVENMLAYEEIARLKARLEEENVYLREEALSGGGLEGIIGESRQIRRVKQAVTTVAETDATVLITGETGTGKELVARAIHEGSPRRGRTLVKVNCAALPASLIESELFGHERGAFTGALARKLGRFELADRGTLFLDEVGDLPLELQAKLLRVLQEGEFERVGGVQTLKVNVRVVAATNQDLEKAVESGRFRADLYYRLNVFPIAVPPLRERREDIPVLVRHLVIRNAARLGKRIDEVRKRDLEALVAYGWPGNVRELENVVERAVILTRGPALELGDCLPVAAPASPRSCGMPTLAEIEHVHIIEALRSTRGRVSGPRGAARLLGIKPTTLEARIRRLGIQKPR